MDASVMSSVRRAGEYSLPMDLYVDKDDVACKCMRLHEDFLVAVRKEVCS